MAAESTVRTNGSSDGNLAATYALIYSFLNAHSHVKAAAAVKKAIKDIVVLKDNVSVNDVSLDEIVKWWKAKKEADANDVSSSEDSSSSSSSSESDSSSDSSDSDSSQDANNGLQKVVKVAKANGQHVTPSTMTSNHKPNSGNHQGKASKKSDDRLPKKSGKPTTSSASSSSSDSGSSSSDSESSSSDSDSDSSDSQPVTKSITVDQVTAQTSKAEAAVVTDGSTVRTTKKRRISESGKAVTTATIAETSSPAPNQNDKTNGKKPRKSNTPFQRIKVDAVEFHDERLKDNAFVARGASANDYGARANQDLIVTRGDSFRKEKNKKKRGSYRGGEITMQSHSIKFT